MADFLDLAMPIVEKDDNGDLIATPYFEDYLFQIINSIGGEGSDIAATVESARKIDTLLVAVLDRVPLGFPLTSDTTGFTADSTELFVDLTES